MERRFRNRVQSRSPIRNNNSETSNRRYTDENRAPPITEVRIDQERRVPNSLRQSHHSEEENKRSFVALNQIHPIDNNQVEFGSLNNMNNNPILQNNINIREIELERRLNREASQNVDVEVNPVVDFREPSVNVSSSERNGRDSNPRNAPNDNPESQKKESAFLAFAKEIELRKIIFAFFQIIYFGLFFSIFVRSAIMRENRRELSEYPYFREILINWEKSPLTNIRYCKENDNKEDNILIDNKYMGTVYGCSCFKSIIREDTCRDRNECNIYSRRPIKNYTTWRNNQICTEKLGSGYLDLIKEEKASDCPKGTRSCGIIDSDNNHLCLENEKECPINSINFVNLEDSSNMLSLKNKNLLFNNKGSSKNAIIPIQFKLGEDKPCKNPYFSNINRPLHILDYWGERKFCLPYIKNITYNKYLEFSTTGLLNESILNEIYDNTTFRYEESYKKIDTYELNTFISENRIFEELISLPFFSKEIYTGSINLYQRPYFRIKIKCLKKLQSEKEKIRFKKELEFFEIFNVFDDFINKVSLVILIFFFFILLSLLYSFYLKENHYFIIRPFLSIFLYFPAVIVIYLILYDFQKIIEERQNTGSFFLNINCVDSFTIEAFKIFQKDFQGIQSYLELELLLIMISFFLEITIFVILCIGHLINFLLK